MYLKDKTFTLEPHPSGKNTCWIATTKEEDKYFVKFPRTVDNEQQGVEEIFNELLGERILSALGITDIGSSIEQVNLKLAIVQRYHPKNWSNHLNEGLEIANFDEWPTLLAAETWMRQSDRSLDKHEHVGLAVVEGVGIRYKALPLDLGNAFVGQPGGYSEIDEDLTPEWVKTLFWTNREFPRASLEAALAMINSLPVYQFIFEVVAKIKTISNWTESVLSHLDEHADQTALFLLNRRKKLGETLLAWWDQTQAISKSITESVNSEQAAVAA